MKIQHYKSFWRTGIAGVLALGLMACATQLDPRHQEAMRLIGTGGFEQGIKVLEDLTVKFPQQKRYQVDLVNARSNYVNRLLSLSEGERRAGRLDASERILKQAQSLDPHSDRVREGFAELRRDARHVEMTKFARGVFDKGDLEGAWARLEPVLIENPQNTIALDLKQQIEDRRAKARMATPQLEAAFRKPVNLEFRDATVRVVFDALSRSTGINYILDKDIRPDLRTTVVTRLAPLEDAIDLILITNQLEKKVLSPNTILIYPATPQKLKEYQDLVVKGFYLTSADVKQVQNVLRSMLKIREVSIDEKLRLVVVRDTPDAVRLAEKLIAMHDLGEPEVMLELEVLEVRRNRLLELGVQWPDQLTLTPLPSAGTTVTLNDLNNLSSSRIGASLANTIVNLRKQDGDVNLLANPRIRAKNREKAKILIGDRVPVITSNATATGLISQSVQYLDVGLKLEIEPDIQLDREVSMKVALEVSSITREITTATGLLTYQVGTRNASTALRLRDGDTQILAGLINDEDRRTANRIPGFGDLPVLGRLFGSQRNDNQKTEIVLSITPRLIRGLVRPDATISEFWSGTESRLSTRPLVIASVDPGSAKALSAGPVGTPGANDPAQAISQASFNWRAPSNVKIGEEVRLELLVKSERPLRGLPLQIAFDPATFDVVRVEEGEFFRQGGAKTSFAHNIDRAAGRVFVGISRTASDGAQGEAALLSLVLKSKMAKPASEIQVVAATPVVLGAGAVTVSLPRPQIVAVTP
jgi:general secretion pathway protein D